jgi:predicted ester cyclase
MKKIVIVIWIIGTLVSLDANEYKVSKVLDDYLIAWNEHNIKKIDSFYASNVKWYDLGYDHTTEGKKKVSKAITNAFLGSVPDMYWAKNGDVFISGNTIVYEWVYGGTFNGKWGDISVANKKFEIKGISTTTINKNGKIISQKDYYDSYTFQKQLGVIK